MITVILKRNSSYPIIKCPLTQVIREKYDITEELLANCAVTFSMVNEETGMFKIANVAADIVRYEDEYQFLDEPLYVLQYYPKSVDTTEAGIFFGEFKIDFLGDNCGNITLPDVPIQIIIQDSITKTTVI